MTTKIIFYILILPISLLPHSVLYLISDIIYLIIYKIIGYRKGIVLTNLNNSFPDKSKQELENIMSDFYRHFCDIIMESLKGFTISEKEISKRLVIKNPELSNKYANKGKSIIFVGGHYNNWEICAQAFALYSNHKCVGIYKPLSNQFLNKKLIASRSRYGLNLVSMKQSKKSFEESNEAKAIVFGSDQNPSNPNKAYWLQFLNQDTAVLFGAEKYAKEYNWPVVYVSICKVKRGYYEVEYSLITDSPTKQSHGKITEDFTKRLEHDIITQPQYWLWSHKRWKHKR